MGKIVSIIGPARCGKSYLTKKLAEHYNAPAYFEGEEPEFPSEIVEDLSKNIRPLERFMYFHNRTTFNMLHAIDDARSNRYVFLDTCWLTNPPWLDVYDATPLEKQLLQEICDIDAKLMPWPDIIVYLTADVATSKRLMANSGREFDRYFEKAMRDSKQMFAEYMRTFEKKVPLIEFDRTGTEFDRPEDLERLTEQIESA